jgi:Mg/Co/Ni transporter MgtE
MRIAIGLNPFFAALHPPRAALRRGLIAGSAWGIVMGVILTALGAWDCGVVCITDAALTTATAMAAGICTIGPLAAFGARPA